MELFNAVLKPSGECIQCGAAIYQGLPHFTCPTAKARRTDPLTSIEAARQVERSGKAATHRAKCLEVVRAHPGLTSGEVAELAGLERHESARRLPELRAGGKVRNGDARKCRINGTWGITWWAL